MLARALLLVVVLSLTFSVQAQDENPPEPLTTIRLSYFSAVDEATVSTFLDTVRTTLEDSEIDLELVALEDGQPMAHVLFRPISNRADERSAVTYVLNLFETPALTDHARALDPTLSGAVAQFSADPIISARFTAAILLITVIGDCDSALPILDTLQDEVDQPLWNPHLDFYRGHCAVLDAEYEQAASLFESSLTLPSGDYQWASVLNLAYSLIQDEQADEGLALLLELDENLPSFSPEYNDTLTRRAALYCEIGDTSACQADLESVLSLSPAYVPALLERGLLALSLDDIAQARADLSAVIATDPESALARTAQEVLDAMDS